MNDRNRVNITVTPSARLLRSLQRVGSVETPEAFQFIAPRHGSANRSSFPPVAKTTAVTCKLRLHAWLPWGCALQHGAKTRSATEDL